MWLACLFPVDAWWLIAGEGAPGRQVVGCGWRASARWYMCKVLRLQKRCNAGLEQEKTVLLLVAHNGRSSRLTKTTHAD